MDVMVAKDINAVTSQWCPAASSTSCSHSPSISLLPIDLVAAQLWWLDGARIAPLLDRGFPIVHCLAVSQAALLSLNFLACAGWTAAPVCLDSRPVLSQAQVQTICSIWDASADLLLHSPGAYSAQDLMRELETMQLDYSGEVVSRRRTLEVDFEGR